MISLLKSYFNNVIKKTNIFTSIFFLLLIYNLNITSIKANEVNEESKDNTQVVESIKDDSLEKKNVEKPSNIQSNTDKEILTNSDHINELLITLKDSEKRNQLIQQLQTLQQLNEVKVEPKDNTQSTKYSLDKLLDVSDIFSSLKGYFKVLTKIDVLFINTYTNLKNYSMDLLKAILTIQYSIKNIVSSENFLSNVINILISVISICMFMALSYLIEKNINMFFIKNYSQKLRGNKLIDKLIYIAITLVAAFIPVVGASLVSIMFAVVGYSLLSTFFDIELTFISLLIKFALLWIFFRTLLIFVRKMLLVSFILNFWGYLHATYKDVRELYIWFRIFLILFFTFLVSLTIIPQNIETIIQFHLIIIKIFFIIFTIILFIFLYKFKSKIQKGLLTFAKNTKYFYVRKLFNFISKRFYILALVYVVIILNCFVLGKYSSVFYFLNTTFFTIIIIILHHFFQYFGAKYIKKIFSSRFIELIKEIYKEDQHKKNLYVDILGNPKLEILLETLYYYAVFLVFFLFTLEIWGIKVHNCIIYIYEISFIKPIFKVLLVFITLLIITLIILLFFRRRILYLIKYERFDKINQILSILLLFKNIYIIVCVSLLIIFSLHAFGISVGALITSTGIITLFVALGAKDIMSNFFNALLCILENTFAVGDIISISGSRGVIEDITSTYVKLRDFEGNLHMIPFSQISKIVNETKGFSYVYSIISVDYNSNLNKVIPLLRKAGSSLLEDPAFCSYILTPLEITTTYNFTAATIDILCKIKTQPGKQFAIKREFLKGVKVLFSQNGTEVKSKSTITTQYLIQ